MTENHYLVDPLIGGTPARLGRGIGGYIPSASWLGERDKKMDSVTASNSHAVLIAQIVDLKLQVDKMREALEEAKRLLAINRTSPHTSESFKAVDINLALRVINKALAP